MSDKKTVELIPAFFWHCPNCDEENFSKAVSPELSKEDVNEIRANIASTYILPIDEINLDSSSLLSQPEKVVCKSCLQTFETIEWGSTISQNNDNNDSGEPLILVP